MSGFLIAGAGVIGMVVQSLMRNHGTMYVSTALAQMNEKGPYIQFLRAIQQKEPADLAIALQRMGALEDDRIAKVGRGNTSESTDDVFIAAVGKKGNQEQREFRGGYLAIKIDAALQRWTDDSLPYVVGLKKPKIEEVVFSRGGIDYHKMDVARRHPTHLFVLQRRFDLFFQVFGLQRNGSFDEDIDHEGTRLIVLSLRQAFSDQINNVQLVERFSKGLQSSILRNMVIGNLWTGLAFTVSLVSLVAIFGGLYLESQ